MDKRAASKSKQTSKKQTKLHLKPIKTHNKTLIKAPEKKNSKNLHLKVIKSDKKSKSASPVPIKKEHKPLKIKVAKSKSAKSTANFAKHLTAALTGKKKSKDIKAALHEKLENLGTDQIKDLIVKQKAINSSKPAKKIVIKPAPVVKKADTLKSKKNSLVISGAETEDDLKAADSVEQEKTAS